jgi:hypothetical protein
LSLVCPDARLLFQISDSNPWCSFSVDREVSTRVLLLLVVRSSCTERDCCADACSRRRDSAIIHSTICDDSACNSCAARRFTPRRAAARNYPRHGHSSSARALATYPPSPPGRLSYVRRSYRRTGEGETSSCAPSAAAWISFVGEPPVPAFLFELPPTDSLNAEVRLQLGHIISARALDAPCAGPDGGRRCRFSLVCPSLAEFPLRSRHTHPVAQLSEVFSSRSPRHSPRAAPNNVRVRQIPSVRPVLSRCPSH